MMKTSVTSIRLTAALLLSLVVISCQKQIKGDADVQPAGAPSPVEIRFKHVFNRFNELNTDSTFYIPGLPPTPVKFTAFKYYISNLSLVSADGDTIFIPDTYFLIDHNKPASMNALFTVPADNYYGMSFLVGIDHARNMQGAGTGQLDPSLGMFWNATDGYIMAKLEGTSPASPLPGNVFRYHIGGTKEPFNVTGRRHFKLGGNANVTPNRKLVININTDALNWFSNPFTLDIGANPAADAPGQLALDISRNYYKMFSFVSIKYE